MARALWIAQEPPDRDLGGGSIRQAHLIEALGRRVPTDLLLAGQLRDERTRAALSRVIEVDDPPRWDPPNRTVRRMADLWLGLAERTPREAWDLRGARRSLAQAIEGLREGPYDVVVVNHQGLTPLLPPDHRGCWVAHLHNVAAQRAAQTAATAPGRRQRWIYRREARKAEQLERWAVGAYDAVVVCSDQDADALCGPDRSLARGPVIVAPNGVDLSRFRRAPIPRRPGLVMTATLDYLPNVDGALWFAKEVLPLIRAQGVDVEFDLVGRNPTAEVMALGGLDGVTIHPDVPDVAPFLARARVAVVPLRMGTGTRLKALEALAVGRPLVGTSIGLAGLGLTDGTDARIADQPRALADAIVELMASDDRAESIAAAGHRLVQGRYGWDHIGARFADALHALLPVAP